MSSNNLKYAVHALELNYYKRKCRNGDTVMSATYGFTGSQVEKILQDIPVVLGILNCLLNIENYIFTVKQLSELTLDSITKNNNIFSVGDLL